MPFINIVSVKIKDKLSHIKNNFFPKGCYYGVYLNERKNCLYNFT